MADQLQGQSAAVVHKFGGCLGRWSAPSIRGSAQSTRFYSSRDARRIPSWTQVVLGQGPEPAAFSKFIVARLLGPVVLLRKCPGHSEAPIRLGGVTRMAVQRLKERVIQRFAREDSLLVIVPQHLV